jgi:hypothetical protein
MSERVLGINYEGGKAIRAACASPKCVAAFNCQIAMDAPFEEGKDAPEEVRQKGRTETRLGASDEQIAEQLAPVLQNAVTSMEEKKGTLVVQIARGRSALPFWAEVVKPVLDRCLSDTPSKVNVILKTGYRTTDYFDFESAEYPFVYLNIGMFGRLTPNVAPGDVFAVSSTVVVDASSDPKKMASSSKMDHRGEDSALTLLPPCSLVSIPDAFPFVTPNSYDKSTIMPLFD